ncbi:MspA family porin [Rhodococcus sp. NPDC127528]|uniref:MspA family porin n=1 Tax=unclassified Rhodococcus (in: high G+C Gram-positive bacteria) TaxID=192944 RepID=UPI00362F20CB
MTEIRRQRRFRTINSKRAVAVAGVVAVGLVFGTGTAAAGVDNANSLVDFSGDRVEVSQGDTQINAVPPLDSSPLSREFFHNGYAEVQITGPNAAAAKGTKLTFGYQLGYPIALTGATIQLNTPRLGFELEHSNNALVGFGGGVAPSLALNANNRGELLGDIIPQQNFTFDLQPGGITDVPVVKDKSFDGPGARLRIAGVHGSVSGAIGQVTIRPYARAETEAGDIVMTYGAPVPL